MAGYDYDGIKTLADRLRQSGGRWSVEDLLALARKNDPFYVGQPAQRSAAEWFADIWSRFEFPVGFHLRRGHYVLVSQKSPVPMPDGAPTPTSVSPLVRSTWWGRSPARSA